MIQQDAMTVDTVPKSYTKQWALFFLLMGAAGWLYWAPTHVSRARPDYAGSAGAAGSDAFLILRLPEVQAGQDLKAAQLRMAKWVTALDREGFRPMLLSDVVDQLRQRRLLPEKTVVLVIDPGYRQTEEAYVPVLARKRVPAVWLTDGKALREHDKRYISRRRADVMAASGLWDVGFYSPGSAVMLQTRDHGTIAVGGPGLWRADAGRFALNKGIMIGPFHRLNVNNRWTEEDLVNRLLVEWPVQGTKALSIQQIQGRNWGIALNPDAPRGTRFTLRASADKRSGSLYWLGTLGANDMHVRLDVSSMTGQMSVLMRSDPVIGQSLTVNFSPGRVSVQEEQNSQIHPLAVVACPDIQPRLPFKAVFAVMGRQFAMAVNGHPLIALDSVAESASERGMIRLIVQDSIPGVGEARSVLFLYTPLAKTK